MKTAMQELIERLVALSSKYQNAGLLTAIEIGNELLVKEKEQLMAAWLNGFEEIRPYVDHSEDYYNETFKKD